MGSSIAVSLLAPVVRALEELGLGQAVASVSIPDAAVSSRDGQPRGLSVGDVEAMWRAAAAQARDEHVALAVVERLPPGALGLLDHVLTTPATLRVGLAALARVVPVVRPQLELDLVERDGYATLYLSRAPDAAVAPQEDELLLAWLVDRIRHGLVRRAVVSRVAFAHVPAIRTRALEVHFAAEVTFGAGRSSLRLPSSLLDEPIRTGNPVLAAAVAAEVDRLTQADALVTRVLAAIGLGLEQPSIGAVAEALGLSARSLQRELQQRALSFRQLVDRARRARALVLIRTVGVSVDEVAAAVGFRSTGAFYRAFQRWTGRSPAAFRPSDLTEPG